MKYFGKTLEEQQKQMAQLKEMDVAEAVQRLNEVEYGHYMFKVPYDSMKQGQQWIELSKKYLNKKVWSISTRFTGPRKGFGASTLKADATGVRVYITKKNQKNIDEERFQRSMGKLKENSLDQQKDWMKMNKEDEKAYISVLKHPYTKQLEEQIKTLEDEHNELEATYTGNKAYIKQLEDELDAVHTVDETLTKQLEEKISLLEDENSKLVDDWESKECDYIEEAETLRSENLDYEQREEELEDQIEQLKEDIADKELDEKDLYKLIDELEKNIEEHKNYVEKNWFLKLVYIIKNWSNK